MQFQVDLAIAYIIIAEIDSNSAHQLLTNAINILESPYQNNLLTPRQIEIYEYIQASLDKLK